MRFIRRPLCAVLVSLFLFGIFPAARVGVTAKAIGPVEVREKLEEFKALYPPGIRWEGEFHGSNQCKGFARMAVYHIFGQTASGAYRQWSYNGMNNTGMTRLGSVTVFSAENVQKLLQNAVIGDVLQFDEPRKHSMIVCGVEDDGVWIFDCNANYDLLVRYEKRSFGCWYGKNCARLTLLRADNYDVRSEYYTLGDVNTDGRITSEDARLALRAAARLETLSAIRRTLADANEDGKIWSSDARAILRIAAKLDPTPEKRIPAA